ncbi:MAG: hypothetical protein FWG31_03040 [Oscillospiraceae bacterium]|nr:hypothetical protein [Oscillospiraceae bacterium]
MIILANEFTKAITEIEALTDYYESFKNVITESDIKLNDEYKIGIGLSNVFDKIMSADEPDRAIALDDARTQRLYDIPVNDIVDMSLENTFDAKILRYLLKGKYATDERYAPSIARKKYHGIESQREILIRSVLANIIIIFEMYLSSIYRFLISIRPEIYFEGATVKFSEIITNEIEDLINEKIIQEVSKKMRESLTVLDIIKQKSGIDVDRNIKIRKEFEEIYYRRNLFVHNNGAINEIYLNNVEKEYCGNYSKKDRLVCDDIYLCNAIFVLKKITCSLFYELLKSQEAPHELYSVLSVSVGFTALCKGEYIVAEYVYGLLRRYKDFLFVEKAMYEVNYMIALKHQGKPINHLLKGFDVSAMTENYIIAKECLLGNNEKVYEMLTKTYPESFDAISIRDWPIFIDFRETELYGKFKAEHIDDFNEYIFS